MTEIRSENNGESGILIEEDNELLFGCSGIHDGDTGVAEISARPGENQNKP